MRQNNIDAFFALLRAGLFGHTDSSENTEKILWAEVDWEKVYQLAEEQSVIGLVSGGIDWFKVHDSRFKVPQEWSLQFIGSALQLEQSNKEMNKFIADLVGRMREKGIYTLLLKGQGVAQCYERPLWRANGDVDFFLSEDNYDKAKKMLLPLASEIEPESKSSKHLGMTIDSWVVELHGSLRMGVPLRINRELDKITRETFYEGNVSSWTNGITLIFLLSRENDAVYVFAYFFNHFYKGGIGLRQICDWARLLWVHRDNLDLNKVEKHIRQMGLMTEWKAFGAFTVKYLGMPKDAMPFYEEDTKWESKAKRIKEFILMSGNFGHNRDLSYYEKYPYLVRKVISLGRRCGDLLRHARIFPLDSLKFSFWIMFNGVRSAVRGE